MSSTTNLPSWMDENQHVNQVYEQIAEHFSNTRYKPWPVVQEFLNGQPDNSIGADVGCGNGKYLSSVPNTPRYALFASDRSKNLLQIAFEKHPLSNPMICDNQTLAYRERVFDFAISIAVIHHFNSPERRANALLEIYRTLKIGGKALVYVWALEQESRFNFEKDKQDILVPWHLSTPPKKKTVPEGEGEDTETSAPKTFHRYYHLFRKGELEDLLFSVLKKDVEVRVEKSGYDKDNWYCVFERLS